MENKVISIVTPTFNEGELIIKCCSEVARIFAKNLDDYILEHIVCDNGSDYESYNIVRSLPDKFPHVKVIVNTRNFGVLPNAYNGAMSASGDAILLFLPVDLQDPPMLIPKFVELWSRQGYDLVYGIRKNRKESWYLRNSRHLFYLILSKLSKVPYPANAGDFQLVDRRILNAVKEMNDRRPFLRMSTFMVGGKSIGIPYTWEQAERPSKNGFFKMLDQALTGMTSYSSAPMRLATWTGFFVFFFSLLYAIGSIISVIFLGKDILDGMLSILVGVFVLGGLNLMFIGIVGEYLLHVHENGRGHRIVYEKERFNFD